MTYAIIAILWAAFILFGIQLFKPSARQSRAEEMRDNDPI